MKSDIKLEDVMVFKHENNGSAWYSIGVSSKKFVNGQRTDEKVTSYMTVKFVGGNAPENKEHIDVTKSFFGAYEGNGGKNGINLIVQEWNHHDEDDEYPWR